MLRMFTKKDKNKNAWYSSKIGRPVVSKILEMSQHWCPDFFQSIQCKAVDQTCPFYNLSQLVQTGRDEIGDSSQTSKRVRENLLYRTCLKWKEILKSTYSSPKQFWSTLFRFEIVMASGTAMSKHKGSLEKKSHLNLNCRKKCFMHQWRRNL